ncbi:outer membrane beta-barrel protein [Pontibacter cellulosilyticus]|uniref:Outer membrane beta-barrel protein n=1 Tax=Pontibacter cellulosilyticus TaxID=1720253 RepID=A0A923SIR1_9BACT|nr:outer membrane beta-barrel protein [Pontibacter cellulosilyticus]MBC5992872.1 outer membrane beta-barrel protein [Pontibacter cellulosilyticus]
MSSSDRKEYGELEQSMWQRFQDAEALPSSDVWSRIDHELTLEESKHYRSRMVLYRQLAAACFVLFMLAGALLTYHYKTEATIDAGIANMQLNTSTGVEEIAVTEQPSIAPQAQASFETKQNIATASVAEASQPQADAAMQKRTGMAGASVVGKAQAAAAATTGTAPIAKVRAQKLAGIGVASGTAKYNLNSAVAAATETSATAEEQSIFNTYKSEESGSMSVSSRFNIGQSFFQTARQAITSVPPSYTNSSAQSINNEPGRSRSFVELSQAAVADNLKEQKKAEELAIALNTPAQAGEKEEKSSGEDSRWSLGLGYAPSYFNQNIQMPGQMMDAVAHRSLIAGGPDLLSSSADNMNEAREEFEANTDPAFSFAAEAKAGFNLFKKFKLLAGIGFTQNSARTKSSYIVNQFLYKPGSNKRVEMPGTTVFLPSLNNNFTTDSLSVEKTDDFYVNYRYRHITLPVGLQYEGNVSKDWFWYASAGMAANFLVETAVMASNSEVRDVSYDHNDDSPFRKVQFSGNASVGLGKRISNFISVTAGPEFRGYLNSLLAEPDKALAPQGNPYTIGINMSVNYSLGKK